MSILIKGMEMPTNHPLWIVVHSDGTVEVNEVSASLPVGWHTLRNAAVPVPPHGRLIDADALIADLKRQCREVFRVDAVSPDDFWITRNEGYNERLWETWCESFFGYLRTRPTIIQTEEGE